MSQEELLKKLKNFLQSYYTNIICTDDYIIAEGTDEVALVAHLDTVGLVAPEEIYYDFEQEVMWSPQLLGADDRAGVYAIIQIIKKGYNPHIIFTCNEELGGLGASELIKKYPKYPFKPVKALIELDRQGYNDSVYYLCENKEFETYINNFGFHTNQGIFSDISILAPQWGIASVNLSIGYIREHTCLETLHLDWIETTIDKVCKIISSIDKQQYFKFLSGNKKIECLCCGRKFSTDKINMTNGFPLCLDCYNFNFE